MRTHLRACRSAWFPSLPLKLNHARTEAPQKDLSDIGTRIFNEANSILLGIFLFGYYWESYLEKKRSKIHFTKSYQADLDSPRQELSNDSLGIFVALAVFWELFFRVFLLGAQSSCKIK